MTQRSCQGKTLGHGEKLMPINIPQNERIRTAPEGKNGFHQGSDGAALHEETEPTSPTLDALLRMPDDVWKAHDRHKTDRPRFGRAIRFEDMERVKQPKFMGRSRRLAELLSFLRHDTPERRTLLKAACIEGDLPEAFMRRFAEELFNTLDYLHESEEFLWADNHLRIDELDTGYGLHTRRLSHVMEQETQWLWWQRIPRNRISIFSGDPEVGKTWAMLDVMARVTTGQGFPDGAVNPFVEESTVTDDPRRDCLWISAEDEDEDIHRRIKLLGGDPSRIHSLQFVMTEGGKEEMLGLKQHLGVLDLWLKDHPLVGLVGIDPLAAFLGKIDSHRNSDVRSLLTPLAKVCAIRKATVLGANHLAKGDGDNAMYRGMGSVAFVAASRSSWLVTKDPKDEDRRLFTKIKCNLQTEDVGGLAFRFAAKDKGISWEKDKVLTTANQALKVLGVDRTGAREEAKEWLKALLANKPVPADEVLGQAKADGICIATLKAAKKELGIRTDKTGGTGKGWEWTMPKPKAAGENG
jgi:hypothetical protein